MGNALPQSKKTAQRSMGGTYNTPSDQGSFSISPQSRLTKIPEMDCAARLLKDVAGPVIHDGRIRITSQACPKLPCGTGPVPLPRKREDLPDF
jgi:hypothetical protein